jgi:hypothetical protein
MDRRCYSCHGGLTISPDFNKILEREINIMFKKIFLTIVLLSSLFLISAKTAYSQEHNSGFKIILRIGGYDDNGYDRYGYDREGYDRERYDRNGFDRDGYGRDGYDRNNCDRNGYYRNNREHNEKENYEHHDNGKHKGWYKNKRERRD